MTAWSRNGDVLRYCAGVGFRSRVTCMRVPRLPTYDTSMSVLAVIWRCTATCQRCMYDEVELGSKNVIPWPRLVAMPPEDPGGSKKPPGNGFFKLAEYVSPWSTDATRSVDCVKPVWLTLTFTTPSASKKIPYPPRRTVFGVSE